MRTVPIASIEVAGSGELQVKSSVPTSDTFEHIYRAANGVHWVEESHSFVPASLGDLSHAQ